MHGNRGLRVVAMASLVATIVAGRYAPAAQAATAAADPSVSVDLDRDVYRLGDSITGTLTVTNRGDADAEAGVAVHVFETSMHISSIDWGAFTRTNTTMAVLNRPMAAGETLKVVVHASATGFLLAPSSTSFTGRVDYTGDATKTNNWDQVAAAYDTSGQTALVSGTVFADTNRDGVRQSGEPGGELAGPSLWWAPGQGQGVGIHADGRYSFTGIIGQGYELHFDVYDSATNVGTSERVYTFTLGSGGRTVNYGVAPKNAPTSVPTTPGATSTPAHPATPGPAPSTPRTSGSSVALNGGGSGTNSNPVVVGASVSPTQYGEPTDTPTGEAAGSAASDLVVDARRSDTSGSSTWPWLVLGLAILAGIGFVFGRRAYRARSADE